MRDVKDVWAVSKKSQFLDLFLITKNEYNVLFDNINLLMSMNSFILIDFSFFFHVIYIHYA